MKKLMILSLAIGLFASCNNNSQSSNNTSSGDSSSSQTAKPTDPEAERGLDLIAKNDCLSCHKVSEQLVGPAYEAVAERYKDSSSAIVDTLTARVIRGSSGHWGAAQMTPHPTVPKDDVKAMVKYVLSLKK